MRTKKSLKKLKNILSAESKVQLAQYRSLKKVLKSLRVEQRRLKGELAAAVDENRQQEIGKRLMVISVQRRKGVEVLKELKKQRK